jgi:hypothetical protein
MRPTSTEARNAPWTTGSSTAFWRSRSSGTSTPSMAAEARAPRRDDSADTAGPARRSTRWRYSRSTACRASSTASGTPGSRAMTANGSLTEPDHTRRYVPLPQGTPAAPARSAKRTEAARTAPTAPAAVRFRRLLGGVQGGARSGAKRIVWGGRHIAAQAEPSLTERTPHAPATTHSTRSNSPAHPYDTQRPLEPGPDACQAHPRPSGHKATGAHKAHSIGPFHIHRISQ